MLAGWLIGASKSLKGAHAGSIHRHTCNSLVKGNTGGFQRDVDHQDSSREQIGMSEEKCNRFSGGYPQAWVEMRCFRLVMSAA